LTCLARVALPGAYASASIAVRVIGFIFLLSQILKGFIRFFYYDFALHCCNDIGGTLVTDKQVIVFGEF
jgi:hypothetical protein